LVIGDCSQSLIPTPHSPIPNPQNIKEIFKKNIVLTFRYLNKK